MSDTDNPEYKARILVVDDEPFTLDLVKLTLITDGFFVETAGSGEDALYLLNEHAFDLMLLDVMMPAVSGFDVMRLMKSTPIGATPVIILSAVGSDEAQLTAEELGAIGYLVKPISRGDLLDAVYAALGISVDEDSPD
jgi:DNA-binding response OmpR family regulator